MNSIDSYLNEKLGITSNIFYHVTLSSNVPSILKNGILPSINKEMGDKKAVYMFKSRVELEDALMNWLGEKFPEDKSLSILKINGDGLKVEYDPNVGFEILTPEVVHPSRIIGVEKAD